MEVWDPDVVEPHNLPTQLYRLSDVGRPKVRAIRDIVRQFIGAGVEINQARWRPPVDLGAIYVSGVDSMDARREIWEGMRTLPPRLYVDARMGALHSMILAVTPDRAEKYARTLDSDGVLREPCTARATFFTGTGIAAAIASTVFRFVRGEDVPFMTTIHWGTMEVA